MLHLENSLEEIKPDFASSFLCGEIPKTGYQNCQYKWFSTDLESRAHETPHDDEINYVFNDHGYRCQNFDRKDGVVVVTIGCSFSFGNGVPAGRRFSAVFCDLLAERLGTEVADWNMSWPGSSGDYTSRIAMAAIPRLKPDIVLVNFPHSPRREYFDIDGVIFQHRPDRKAKSPKDADLLAHHRGLSSPCQDAYNMLKNYTLIRSLCQLNDSKFLYATLKVDKSTYDMIRHCFDERYMAASLSKTDTGRDGAHPGVGTHNAHGRNFFNAFLGAYGA